MLVSIFMKLLYLLPLREARTFVVGSLKEIRSLTFIFGVVFPLCTSYLQPVAAVYLLIFSPLWRQLSGTACHLNASPLNGGRLFLLRLIKLGVRRMECQTQELH